MLEEIIKLLLGTPELKAKDVARLLSGDSDASKVSTKQVNQLLHANSDIFTQDSDSFSWTVKTCQIRFKGHCWLNSRRFETTLQRAGCPMSSSEPILHFIFPLGCKLLLEAASRMMTLSNQLIHRGKSVVLDFSESTTTMRYLTRMGFFVHLDPAVVVLPKRPSDSVAKRYKGQNIELVEFLSIDPSVDDQRPPKLLRDSFVHHTDKSFFQPAFTVFAEFINNIRDHSETPVHGFASLQAYKNASPPHIQTVISDSGVGIAGTLWPIIETDYPEVADAVRDSEHPDAHLVKEVFQRGAISSLGVEAGRGSGFLSTYAVAKKFNAKVLIRQEDFEVFLQFRNGALETFRHFSNLVRIIGTQICFDFTLDA